MAIIANITKIEEMITSNSRIITIPVISFKIEETRKNMKNVSKLNIKNNQLN